MKKKGSALRPKVDVGLRKTFARPICGPKEGLRDETQKVEEVGWVCCPNNPDVLRKIVGYDENGLPIILERHLNAREPEEDKDGVK